MQTGNRKEMTQPETLERLPGRLGQGTAVTRRERTNESAAISSRCQALAEFSSETATLALCHPSKRIESRRDPPLAFDDLDDPGGIDQRCAHPEPSDREQPFLIARSGIPRESKGREANGQPVPRPRREQLVRPSRLPGGWFREAHQESARNRDAAVDGANLDQLDLITEATRSPRVDTSLHTTNRVRTDRPRASAILSGGVDSNRKPEDTRRERQQTNGPEDQRSAAHARQDPTSEDPVDTSSIVHLP
jgi:hypothetical protein